MINIEMQVVRSRLDLLGACHVIPKILCTVFIMVGASGYRVLVNM